MDASRFDTFAKSLAVSFPRRQLLKLLGGLGLGGVLLRTAGRDAAAIAKCPSITCQPGVCIYCQYNESETKCTCACRTCVIVGIVGGGTVRIDRGGEATLSLLATRSEKPDQPGTFSMQGSVAWSDPAWEGTGLALDSVGIAFYGPLEGVEGGREVSGWMRTDQAPGQYPFVLRAVDSGLPGSGEDTVTLWVGDAVRDDPAVAAAFEATLEPSGFGYHAEGTMVAGDLKLVNLPSPTDPATPES